MSLRIRRHRPRLRPGISLYPAALRLVPGAALALGLAAPLAAQDELFIDFNSLTQDGGPHPEPGYQSYDAGHEVAADFIPMDYPAFGTTVTVRPAWPDTTDNRVQQMIDRGAGNDANWLGFKIDLLTDWIGVDTRTGNGGNGDFDGVTGTPTRMTLTLGGLPPATYQWRSYHHDTEHVHASFLLEISTDGGASFMPVEGPDLDGSFPGTDSTPGGEPDSGITYDGFFDPESGDPADLPSTVTTTLTATGSDVVLRFTPLANTGVHRQLFVLNGFELTVTDSEDTDGDGMNDVWEMANGLVVGIDDSGLDPDGDGLTNGAEFARGTDPQDADTDDDGLLDAAETNTGIWISTADTGTNPRLPDTDGDGLPDGLENPDLPFVDESQPGSDPNLADTDGDFHDDAFEVAEGTDPSDATDLPRMTDGLWVDFSNGGNQNAGPQHEAFYQAFVANHEVDGEVDAEKAFPAFGTTVTLAVDFPDTFDNRVKQMINRSDAETANYIGTNAALVRDWIGADARIENGGNGDFSPTTMRFTFTGLPAGSYRYRAYHHDVQNLFSPFEVVISDGYGADRALGTFRMTSSTALGENPGAGNGPDALASTNTFLVRSDGVAPVVVEYRAFETFDEAFVTIVQESFVAVNGFELDSAEDVDNDRMPDDYETANGLVVGVDDSADDADGDGSPNLEEFQRRTDPQNPDTDGDGAPDGSETRTGVFVDLDDRGTDPLDPDGDRDGLPDGAETNTGTFVSTEDAGSDPFVPDTDGDLFPDGFEVARGSDPNNPADLPGREDGALWIDFSNAGNQAGGPQHDFDYQPFLANHEVDGEVDQTVEYRAFGRTVSLTVAFPDTFVNTVKQMINRGDGLVANYVGERPDLVRDWIGADARIANGGNGPGFDTTMTFTLEGLPNGTFRYRAYHHDVEYMRCPFAIRVSDALGADRDIGSFTMTHSSINEGTGSVSPTQPGAGNGPEALPSTVEFDLVSNGSPVVISYVTEEREDNVHLSFVGVNGLELDLTRPGAPFQIVAITRDPVTGDVTLEWTSDTASTYTVFMSADMVLWGDLDDSVPGSEGTTTFVDTTPGLDTRQRYYYIQRN